MPWSTLQPPIVTIATSAALASRSATTVARVACTTGLSRLGWVTTTPADRESGGGCRPAVEDIATTTIQSRAPPRAGVVELVDTPALGAGGRKPLVVRVPPPACCQLTPTGDRPVIGAEARRDDDLAVCHSLR